MIILDIEQTDRHPISYTFIRPEKRHILYLEKQRCRCKSIRSTQGKGIEDNLFVLLCEIYGKHK